MLTSFIVMAMVIAPAEPPKEKEKQPELSAEAKKELKKLEGKWQIVKGLGTEGEAELKNLEAFCVVKGTEMTFTAGTKKETVEITALDPSTDPKCIDLTESRPGKPLQTSEGVYKIDGD